jgi:hypothetical protein
LIPPPSVTRQRAEHLADRRNISCALCQRSPRHLKRPIT